MMIAAEDRSCGGASFDSQSRISFFDGNTYKGSGKIRLDDEVDFLVADLAMQAGEEVEFRHQIDT